MKGVSAIIVIILILMITVSLASIAYIFFAGMFATTTQAGEEAIEQAKTSMSARMKIDAISVSDLEVSVRNIGDIDLTGFEVYVNDVKDDNPTLPAGNTIAPSDVDIITINPPPALASGDAVKVTSAEGAIAIRTAQ